MVVSRMSKEQVLKLLLINSKPRHVCMRGRPVDTKHWSDFKNGPNNKLSEVNIRSSKVKPCQLFLLKSDRLVMTMICVGLHRRLN